MAQSVDILIKARDQASKKFSIVGASATIMGKTLKGVGNMMKTAFAAAFRAAKYAVMGLAAAFSYCTYAAIKQEAAEIELASALKMAGEYSEELIQKMKKQAAEIQAATVYGDEYVLTLMRIAMSQGVAADKAAEAAKAAIALYEGFGGGRGKPEIFMRYYIDAIRGTGSSLESYVGELRKAKTEEERHKILQDALARGWDVAKSKTESAGGALKQMKNKLGDIAEAIGRPLLPAIAKSSTAITKWAEENEASISYWANKTYSYVTFVKDVFFDFINFMKEDWRTGISFVFDSFLKLLKTTFDSAVTLAIARGRGIWKGVKIGIFGGKEAQIDKLTEQRYWKERTLGPMTAAEVAAYEAIPLKERPFYKEKYKEVSAEFLKQQTKSILGETLSVVTDSFQETFAEILKDMPADMRKTYEKSQVKLAKRLEALGMPPGKGTAVAAGETGAPTIFDMLKDSIQRAVSTIKRPGLAPREAGLLTMFPGGHMDYQQQLVNYAKEQTTIQRKFIMYQEKLLKYAEELNRKVQQGTPLRAVDLG